MSHHREMREAHKSCVYTPEEKLTLANGGIKHDKGKPQLSRIPTCALVAEANALSYGAKLYGEGNYKLGMKWSRLIDAALRHIHAFKDGEANDKESGVHHLGHAKACLSFLLYYIANDKGEDDR